MNDRAVTPSAEHIGTTLKHKRIQTGTTDEQEVIFLHCGREGGREQFKALLLDLRGNLSAKLT